VKQKSGKGWKIAIVVILVVLLVIGGAVAAIGLLVFSAVKAPIDVTNNYIEAVNEGDAEAAWELLHPDSPFRQDFTFSEFETEVIETSANQLTTWNANEADVSSDRARVEVDLTFTDGDEYRAGFALRKDGGDWLIYDYE
jgi:flagellar basal body-associated protein FliL